LADLLDDDHEADHRLALLHGEDAIGRFPERGRPAEEISDAPLQRSGGGDRPLAHVLGIGKELPRRLLGAQEDALLAPAGPGAHPTPPTRHATEQAPPRDHQNPKATPNSRVLAVSSVRRAGRKFVTPARLLP